MRDEVTIRIAGEAGLGMQTLGDTLAHAAKRAGFCIFAHMDYMSRIRGGNNYYQLRVGGRPLHAPRERFDILVALDKESLPLHKDQVAPGGTLVFDGDTPPAGSGAVAVPFTTIASSQAGDKRYATAVAAGYLAGLIGIPSTAALEALLEETFQAKGADVVAANRTAARAGFELARGGAFAVKPGVLCGKFVMNGNEAIGLGAIKAGCKVYTAYPMTPSTSVMNTVAHFAKQYGIIVEQAEDEIAAVNMAIGASYAGARAMTGTSGGGFALMTEGVSLAAMTETPLVVVNSQRPGPATGFPTRTEQADLEMVLHAGHGEFARVIFAPGSVEQAFSLTFKAFDLAEKYQVSAFILTDQFLADAVRDITLEDADTLRSVRHIMPKQAGGPTGYKRYALGAADGVSPRAVPGWISDPVYADSDEHTEEGHITESAEIRNAMVAKRFHKKMAALEKELVAPEPVNTRGAEILLVGFGSTRGVMLEVATGSAKPRIGMIHLSQVWPFPGRELTRLLDGAKRVFTVENNATGQLARLIRRETGIAVKGSILKYDGRPFTTDELIGRVNDV